MSASDSTGRNIEEPGARSREPGEKGRTVRAKGQKADKGGERGRKIELLSPGGSLEAALAGLEAGSDATYVGLERFSARAEARNLSARELEELCAWARARGKKVYAAVNTLARDDEFAGEGGVCAALETCAACGVDAVIVQDAGVARVARKCFPGLRLHASTQMAVHNVEGARAAGAAGFARVTLARELGLDEIREVARGWKGEVECFAQGALCYAYSGLCLYSALARGRSGNRGACAYPCREAFRGEDGREALCFSMMDLGAAGLAGELAASGAASLKIEGRMKAPAYVGAAVRLWRGLLDGTLRGGALREAERELKTLFSRTWTELHLRARRGVAVIDPKTTGHRGVPVGRVEAAGRGWLQFRPETALEAHDGLQVEAEGETRPYGFAVEGMTTRDGRERFRVEAGTLVQVDVPEGAPWIGAGTRLYLASSQELKRKWRVAAPNPREWRRRLPMRVAGRAEGEGAVVRATARDGKAEFAAEARVDGPLEAPRNPGAMAKAAEEAFGKVGETPFSLESMEWPEMPFLPVSRLNALRRELADSLEAQWRAWRAGRAAAAERVAAEGVAGGQAPEGGARLIVKTDQPDALREALEGVEGTLRIGEVVVEWAPGTREGALDELRAALGGAVAVRRSLPAVMRPWDREGARAWVREGLDRGERLWEVANLGGLGLLREMAGAAWAELDVSADWPLYAWNRAAVAEWAGRGLSRWTLSPEDSTDNARALAAAMPWRTVWIVHRDPPLFLSENCPETAREGHCPGPSKCRYEGETLTNRAGETVRVVNRHCRFATLLAEPTVHPLPPGMPAWPRADFLWRPWTPEALRHALFHVI